MMARLRWGSQRRGQLKRVARWINEGWIGDLIGTFCLFALLYMLLLICWVLS